MKANLNHQDAPKQLEKTRSPRKTPKLGCWSTGCLVAVGIIMVPYILNAVYLLGGSVINQVKWHRRGSPSYTATVSMTAFSPLAGTNKITVSNGQVIAVESSWREANIYIHNFDALTIERMFSSVKGCVINFPLVWCSIKYDPYYGYPKKFMIDCPIPDACMTHYQIEEFEIIQP